MLVTNENRDDFLAWLGERHPIIAIDTEDTGLHWNDTVRLVQFGDSQRGWAVPITTQRPLLDVLFKRMEESCEPTDFVFHNLKFDVHKLVQAGLKAEWLLGAHDTALMAHSFDAAGNHKLKVLGEEILGVSTDAEKALKDSFKGTGRQEFYKELRADGWAVKEARVEAAIRSEASKLTWETIPIDNELYVLYAVNDVLLTAGIFEYFQTVMRPEDMKTYEFELRVQQVLYAMEKKGLLIDEPYTLNLKAKWADEITVLGEQIERAKADAWGNYYEAGRSSPGSTDQIASVLQLSGWKPKAFTATGKVQLDKNVIDDLAIGYPIAKTFQDYKRRIKWTSAYLDHFLSERDPLGRVHASINGARARTGRMSITDPALQTLPSHDPLVRGCIIPPPGAKLLAVDYSQIEMLILASLAGEESMMEAKRQGLDLHNYTAKEVYEVEEVTHDQRQLAKIANYATSYGGGARAISRQAKVPLVVARNFRASYFRKYPAIKRLIDSASAGAKSRGFIDLATGRRLPVDFGHEYAAVNYLVQGTAAEVLKGALVRLSDAGLEQYMLIPVHDEVLFEVPTDEAQDVLYAAEDLMADHGFDIPITTDGSIMERSWGEKYED